MARLASKERMGFYPTPIALGEVIASYVKSTPGGWGFDPCCGEGLFLEKLGSLWNTDTLGVEIHSERVQEARHRLSRAVDADFLTGIKASHGQFRYCWNNPPYDYDDGVRTEMKFNEAMHYVCKSGWYGWCVPGSILNKRVARSMSSRLSETTVWRFPDPDYEAFGQVVLMGLVRGKPSKDIEQYERLCELFEDVSVLPVLELQENPLYSLPAPPQGKFYFRGTFVNYGALADELTVAELESEPEFDAFFFKDRPEKLVSVMPFRRGHLLQLLAADVLSDAFLEQGDRQIILSGRARKVIRTVPDPGKTNEKWIGKIETSAFVTDLCELDVKANKYTLYTNETPDKSRELADMFEEWVGPLSRAVVDRFRFLYNFNFAEVFSSEQQRILANIGLAKSIPNREERGLLPGQLHAIAAAYKSLLESGHVFFNAQMGFGKSPSAVSLMALANHKHRKKYGDAVKEHPGLFVFMTEPHLVEQMRQETEDFWTLQASDGNGDVRLVHRPIVRVCEWPADIVQLVRSAFLHPARPHVAIISRMTAKLTSGWAPAYQPKRILVAMVNQPPRRRWRKVDGKWIRECVPEVPFTADGFLQQRPVTLVDVEIDADGCHRIVPGSEVESIETTLFTDDQWQGCGPKSARLYVVHERHTSWEKGAGICPTCGAWIKEALTPETEGALRFRLTKQELDARLSKIQCVCEECGEALWQDTRKVHGKVNGRVYAPDYGELSRRWAYLKHDQAWCDKYRIRRGRITWPSYPPKVRYPLAEYIAKGVMELGGRKVKLVDLFIMGVIDECFPAGTLVAMTTGNTQPIEAVRVGESVLSLKNGELVPRRVARVMKRPLYGDLVKIVHTEGELVCTPNHKIWVGDKYVRADKLVQGDRFTTRASNHHDPRYNARVGSVIILSVEPVTSSEQFVYNLEVEDTHCYFAGNVLVSNCHQYKGGHTAQGLAMGTIAGAVDELAMLTGTLTNGKASSLFYLLYRNLPLIREMFGYHDVNSFARQFGVVQVKRKQRREEADAELAESGSFSRRKTWLKGPEKFLPGISPQVIRWVLASGFFLRMADLGIDLVPRLDSHEALHLTELQHRLYDKFFKSCRLALREASKDGVQLAGAYIHRVLGYANAMFRPHALMDVDGGVWARAPGIEWRCKHCGKFGGPDSHCLKCHPDQDEEERRKLCPTGCFEHHPVVLPKEQWLIDQLLLNREAGVKSLVMCRQTDRLDIIERLLKQAREKGIAVERLPRGKARKRGEWLHAHTPMLDALYLNPMSIETGLNLVEYSRAIFYEPVFRVYTCDQAPARIHRATSTKPVEVVWPVYMNTAEADAVDTVMAGLTVAAMFAGDTYALATYDDGDFIQQMVKRLGKAKLEVPDLSARFTAFIERRKMLSSLVSIENGTAVDAMFSIDRAGAQAAVMNGNRNTQRGVLVDVPGRHLEQLGLW